MDFLVTSSLELFIMERLFGVELDYEKHTQVPITPNPIQFVLSEEYDEDIVEPIIVVLTEFIREVLDENSTVKKKPNQLDVPPIILIFDNTYLMDQPSWRLIESVIFECNSIGFVMLMRTDSNGDPQLLPKAEDVAKSFLSTDKIDSVLELGSINESELNAMLLELAPRYYSQWNDEIEKMTEIPNVKDSKMDPV